MFANHGLAFDMHPIFLLLIGAIFIFFTSIIQLFIRGQKRIYLNVLLSISLFGIIWYVMIFLLTTSGDIKKYPVLYNKGLPLYYLIAPSFFLYVKGSIDEQHSKFKTNHLWHMLLALPGLFSIIPYNLLDAQAQRDVVSQIVNDMDLLFNSNPYIVSNWHWIVLPSVAMIYCIALFRTIHQSQKLPELKPNASRWLYVYTAVLTLFFFCMLIATLRAKFDINGALYVFRQGKFVLLGCFCIFMLSFLFSISPDFIFGLKNSNSNSNGINIQSNSDKTLDDAQVDLGKEVLQDVYHDGNLVGEEWETDNNNKELRKKQIDPELVDKVESMIKRKEIFRQTGLTLSELSSLCELPNHKLSELFNNYYQLSFNGYINKLRIEYVKERLSQGDWKRFTLEAIATDAGFVTRNTFFVAFKKQTGLTPSAYIAYIRDNSPE